MDRLHSCQVDPPPDHRTDAAGAHERGRDRQLLARGVPRAHDPDLTLDEQAGIEREPPVAEGVHEHEPAVLRERAERPGPARLGPDEVDDDVGLRAERARKSHLLEVGRVDGGDSELVLEERKLRVDDVEAGHLSSPKPGELGHVHADASSGPDDGHSVGRSDGREPPDVDWSRDRVGDDGRLHRVERRVERDRVPLGDDAHVGVAAVAGGPDLAGRALAEGLEPCAAERAAAAEEVEVRGYPGAEPRLRGGPARAAVTTPTSSCPGTTGRSSGASAYCPPE